MSLHPREELEKIPHAEKRRHPPGGGNRWPMRFWMWMERRFSGRTFPPAGSVISGSCLMRTISLMNWFLIWESWKQVLGFMDTENYSYGELFNEINCHTGGISMAVNLYGNMREKERFCMKLEMKAKTLYNKTDFAFAMMREILQKTRFTRHQETLLRSLPR